MFCSLSKLHVSSLAQLGFRDLSLVTDTALKVKMGILPKKGALGHFVRVFVVFAGLFAPGTLAADPRSDLAPVRSLRRLTQTPVGYLQSTKLTADDGAGKASRSTATRL